MVSDLLAHTVTLYKFLILLNGMIFFLFQTKIKQFSPQIYVLLSVFYIVLFSSV